MTGKPRRVRQKLLARRINAQLMTDRLYVGKSGPVGIDQAEYVENCSAARDRGVALYESTVRYCQGIDASFAAPVGTFAEPLAT